MDEKGIIFTTDALLALLIITMVIGISINQYDALNYQLQDFTGRQSLEKTVNDAADYLVKNTGSPKNWEKNTPSLSLPGLAVADTASTPDESNVYAISNYLDNKKISALENLENKSEYPLKKLVFTNNYYLKIVALNGSITYGEVGKPAPTTAKEIAVANRTVSLIPGEVLLRMTDLSHLNPNNPANNSNYLWFFNQQNNGGGAKPAIFVGPNKNKPSLDPDNNNVTITYNDLNQYDFYIRVDVNQGGGTGVSSADYGFTSDDWVVNGSYANTNVNPYIDLSILNDTNDNRLEEAIQGELQFINGNSNQGFIKINNKELTTGSFIYVNPTLNATLNKRGEHPLKLWFRVPSDVNADFSISLVKIRKGASLNKVPAQLVLQIWR